MPNARAVRRAPSPPPVRRPPAAWVTELGQATKVGAAIGAVAGAALAARDGARAVMKGEKRKSEVVVEVARASVSGGADGAVKGAAVIGLREVAVRVAPRLARGLVGQTALTAVAIVGVDLVKDAVRYGRGELSADEFQQSAVASGAVAGASLAAGAIVSALVGSVAAPVVAGALAIGGSIAAGVAVERHLRGG